MTPAEIRALRGSRTREQLAAALGVTAHTIYRWEQPAGSPHARRPRGDVLAALRALAAAPAGRGAAPAPRVAARGLASGAAGGFAGGAASFAGGAGGDAGAEAIAEDAASLAVTAAMQRMLDGDHRDAEGVFLRTLAAGTASPAAHVLASAGLALIELMFHADGRRALAALGPALAPGAPTLALAEATAALAYSYPDGELFDVGRVQAHAARAEALARGEQPVAAAFAIAAEANAGMLAGDDDVLNRALARADDLGVGAMPEIPALYVEQLRSLAASRGGQAKLATRCLDRALAHPRIASVPPLHARTLALRALRDLDELGDPVAALARARQAGDIDRAHHLAVGVHTAIALRAEAEALLRLGRIAEVDRVFEASDRIFREHGFPALIVLPAQCRYLLFADRPDALAHMAARLSAVELPSIRGVCQAYAAWFAATAGYARGDEAPAATAAAYAHAERLSERFRWMQRDVLVAAASASLAGADPADARALLSRARRAVSRAPTAWSTAQLRRVEGTLLVAEGRLAEGRTMFEAVAATFQASGDVLDAALARFGQARLLRAIGDPDGDARTVASEAELRAMGLPLPRWIERVTAHVAQGLAAALRDVGPDVPIDAPTNAPTNASSGSRTAAPASTRADAAVLPLEVALQRLSVTGASTAMIRRELAAVARERTGAPVVLAVADDGNGDGDAASGGDDPGVTAWFDVGAQLRLGVTAAEPGPAVRADLRVIALVGGLALEAAALRGGEAAGQADAAAPIAEDIPGLVAASPAMRRVLADVARLAGSRATVVITGESGVGKELIARALHRRSARASTPYVAFNCAAVPHELFEGQLFGYRKGAFTGASADHAGVVRAADSGTLFLDEIGELPLDVQPKLLRFLDNAEVFPLGAARPITVDVRVIAATNRDLAAEVRRGRFREDLYYRLMVVPLAVPPLRARREDIVPLARHFARALAEPGTRPPAFSPDALAALAAHPWPGNVRELRNAIARALAFSPPPDAITRAQLGL